MLCASVKGEYYLNDRTDVNTKELLNVQDNMKGLTSLLKSATECLVKEVIRHKVNMIFLKMACIIYDYLRNEDYNSCWVEVKNPK